MEAGLGTQGPFLIEDQTSTPVIEPFQSSFSVWKNSKWHTQEPLQSAASWLKEKRKLDGAEDLWRIHDKLYNLNEWINQHPGGPQWLSLTKGTDITEAFEIHHIKDTAEKMLNKFYVKEAQTVRNSPFTFDSNGFYMKLKQKIRNHLQTVEDDPTKESKYITDYVAGATILLSVVAVIFRSPFCGVLSALCLACTAVSAHNFFHQRDNWRMNYLHLALLSPRDWRISHVLSHHIYTNLVYDLEVMSFHPIMQWLVRPKTKFQKQFSLMVSPVIWSTIFYSQWAVRIFSNPDGFKELIPLIIPGAMIIIGRGGIIYSFVLWNFILFVSSFFFGFIGLNAGHHHPEVFHDGDKPRQDTDWGLYQLDAVKERAEIKGNLPVVLLTFGDHSIHHLFPALDHSYLKDLYPIVEEHYREYGCELRVTTVIDAIKGQFQQLTRTNPISFI